MATPTPKPSTTDVDPSPALISWLSRMVADPFHLLDCATTSEGGCALVLTTAERAGECEAPVWILGGASDAFGPAYVVAPVWDFQPRADSFPAGLRGARGGRGPPSRRPAPSRATSMWPSSTIPSRSRSSGSSRPLASAKSRGRAARSWRTGNIGAGGQLPVTTHGGTMSFSHPGINVLTAAAGDQGRPAATRIMCQQSGRGGRGRCLLERRLGRPVLRRPAPRARNAHEHPCPQPEGIPRATSEPAESAERGGVAGRHRLLYQRCAECSFSRPRRVHRLRPMPRHVSRLGRERRERLPLQLDRGLAAARSILRGAVRSRRGPAGRGDSG